MFYLKIEKNHTLFKQNLPYRSYFVSFIETVFHNKDPRDPQQDTKYRLKRRNDTHFSSPHCGP